MSELWGSGVMVVLGHPSLQGTVLNGVFGLQIRSTKIDGRIRGDNGGNVNRKMALSK